MNPASFERRIFSITAAALLASLLAIGCATATPSELFARGLASDTSKNTETGRATPGPLTDQDDARDAYEAACMGGHAVACYFFERLMSPRRPRYDAFVEAQKTYKPACEAGDGRACFRWGMLFDDHDGSGIEPARAMALYDKACELGYAYACQRAAALHYFVFWWPISNVETRKLTLRSCDAGFGRACVVAGDLLRAGQGGPVDRPRSRELLTKACLRGQYDACKRLAKRWGFRREDDKTVELFNRLYLPMADACRRGHSSGCAVAMMMAEHRKFSKPAQDPERVLVDGCLEGNVRLACAAAIANQVLPGAPNEV